MYQLLCAVSVSLAIACTTSTNAQMCQNSGKECFDHSDCCGGCCRRNICVDSNRLCSSTDDECETYYCPAGMSCSLYQTPNCPGCAIVPYCQSVQTSPDEVWSKPWPLKSTLL